jgi:hypothetical protein
VESGCQGDVIENWDDNLMEGTEELRGFLEEWGTRWRKWKVLTEAFWLQMEPDIQGQKQK